MPAPFLPLDLCDRPRAPVEPAEHFVDSCAAVEAELLVDLLAADLDQPGAERRRLSALEAGLDRPVLLGREGAELALPLGDDPDRDRPDAARRQPPPDLVPEQRRELV